MSPFGLLIQLPKSNRAEPSGSPSLVLKHLLLCLQWSHFHILACFDCFFFYCGKIYITFTILILFKCTIQCHSILSHFCPTITTMFWFFFKEWLRAERESSLRPTIIVGSFAIYFSSTLSSYQCKELNSGPTHNTPGSN